MNHCLNLGCGNNIKISDGIATWINLDLSTEKGADIMGDLEKGLPMFKDEMFDFVLASHVLEHVQNYIPLIHEIWRVMKPWGTLVIKVPEFPCRAAIADPTHVRFFVPESFSHLVAHSFGFDTGGMAKLFEMNWMESIAHDRPSIDRGVIGSYFTEIHCELLKVLP
jgi:SAM-dependent methyltransferase